MSYNYQTERAEIFTEAGQVSFLAIRDKVKNMLRISGAFQMGNAIEAGRSGSSWTFMACVDRLVELGEIVEITPPNSCAGQYRTFRAA